MEEKKTKSGKKKNTKEKKKKLKKEPEFERNSIYGVPRRKVVYAHVKKVKNFSLLFSACAVFRLAENA